MADQKSQDRIIEVNPVVHLSPRAGDVFLTPEQIQGLSFFRRVEDPRRMPKFHELPGAVLLRLYRDEEKILQQGEMGFTAFYILTTEDLRALHKTSPEIQESWTPPHTSSEPLEVARVHLAVTRKAEGQLPPRSFWDRLWRKPPRIPPKASQAPLYIPFDGPTDVDYETLSASQIHG
jgi:hypothetical protein